MEVKEKIKIMMAEDHNSARQAYVSMLEEEENFVVTGHAENGLELLKLIERNVPEIVITDLDMPVMNGSQLIEILKERYPEVKPIVLSMHDEDVYISQLILRGARAYLPKSCSLVEIIQTVNKVHEDGFCFGKRVSKLVVNGTIADNRLKHSLNDFSLTEREVDVLKLLCEEKSNIQIAEKLNITTKTVDFHRQSIYKKTQTSSIVGLVKYAIRKGLTDL